MKIALSRHGSAGFSLVEIMIVVAIIGMLSVIAIPSFAKSRRQAQIANMMNDFRIVFDAFNMYAMEHGHFPQKESNPNQTYSFSRSSAPEPVAAYLDGAKWTEPTPMGGGWWYINYPGTDTRTGEATRLYLIIADNYNFGGVNKPLAPIQYWQELDEKIDDGNLSTGILHLAGGIQVQYNVGGFPFHL